MLKLNVNGKPANFEGDPDTPILWVLRDHLDVTSPKFGCGMALCGACTVHLDGVPIRSCSTPASAAVGKRITTIEGLPVKVGKALQDAWIAEEVPQCGYCQTGQMMSAAALITKTRIHPRPISSARWTATSVAAEPTAAFKKPSSARVNPSLAREHKEPDL